MIGTTCAVLAFTVMYLVCTPLESTVDEARPENMLREGMTKEEVKSALKAWPDFTLKQASNVIPCDNEGYLSSSFPETYVHCCYSQDREGIPRLFAWRIEASEKILRVLEASECLEPPLRQRAIAALERIDR
jgi:hypothetical protein